MFKAGGMFAGITLNGNEFTPKDLYQLDIWNATYERPEEC
jgi:hypothetical protein